MDFPGASARAAEVSEALDGVMGHLRTLSRALEPSPVRRTGLKNALMDLAEGSHHGTSIRLRYSATATLAPEIADAMYHAITSAVAAAGGAKDVAIFVSGARIACRARRKKALAAAALLARHSGLGFDVTTEKGTIVSIRYAIRRPSGG